MSDVIPALVAEKIEQSPILAEYERAFAALTGMPLRFVPAGSASAKPCLHEHSEENPFCAALANHKAACGLCLEVEATLRDPASGKPKTAICPAGLVDSVVPVLSDGALLGYLCTGQVALNPPKRENFANFAHRLSALGVRTDMTELENLWLRSRVLQSAQHEAAVKLLTVFSRHLGLISKELAEEQLVVDSPVILKAQEYIVIHQRRDLSVNDVARALNMSVFYFCKIFKKATGFTFTAYLAKVRITTAKNLLANLHIRVSEVAYQSGFQSISSFNRVFRSVTGKSPKEYRAWIVEQSGAN